MAYERTRYNRMPLSIFWGMLFSSFVVTLTRWHWETYIQLFGLLILLSAAWRLRGGLPQFRRAFIAGLVTLAVTLGGIVLSATPLSGGVTVNTAAGSAVGILLLVCKLVMYGWLFDGFGHLAAFIYQPALAKKLYRCSGIYVLIYALLLPCFWIPGFLWVAVPLFLVGLIFILVRVYKMLAAINASDEMELPLRRIGWIPPLTALIALAATFGLLMMTLDMVNVPNQISVPYNAAAYQTPAAAGEIRSSLLSLGFDKIVLADLSDSEMPSYQGATSCQALTDGTPMDGGFLNYIFCFVGFGDKTPRIRAVLYYYWSRPPQHCYTDMIYFNITACSQHMMPYDIFPNMSGGFLSEVSGKTVATPPVTLPAYQSQYTPNTTVSAAYRLFGSRENQRAYVAFDAMLDKDSGIQPLYIHQNSCFNLPYQNPLSVAENQTGQNRNTGFVGMDGVPFQIWSPVMTVYSPLSTT